jgi:hypothetical protein
MRVSLRMGWPGDSRLCCLREPIVFSRSACLLVIANVVLCLSTVAVAPSAQSPNASSPGQRARYAAGKDITWMLAFEGKQTDQLVNDPRFTSTLGAYFHNVTLPFNHEAVPDGLLSYFGPPDDVTVADHRYVAASACAPEFCQEKILLWADTEKSAPVLIAAVVLLSREETKDGKQAPHLWLISSLAVGGNSLPQPYVKSLNEWLEVEVYPALRQDSGIAGGGIKSVTLISTPMGKTETLSPKNLSMPPF